MSKGEFVKVRTKEGLKEGTILDLFPLCHLATVEFISNNQAMANTFVKLVSISDILANG